MKKKVFKVLACVLMVTVLLNSTGYVAFAAEPGSGGMLSFDDDDDDGGVFNPGSFYDICQFNPGSFYDLGNTGNTTPAAPAPAPEPKYVEVTRYNCNCGYTTYDYTALKQHMLQHVLKGQRNSYSAHVEMVLQ